MKNNNQKFNLILAVVLIVFALALAAGAYLGIKKTDEIIAKCDSTSDELTIAEYLEIFAADVKEGKMPDKIGTMGLHNVQGSTNEFELPDLLEKMYLASIDADNLKYVLTDYKDLHSEYAILSNDTLVATVLVEGVEKERFFDKFSYVEWSIKDVSAVYSYETFDICAVVPDSFTVTINGVELGTEYLTGEEKAIEEFGYTAEFTEMPKLVEYRAEGFLRTPTIEIYDQNGNAAEVKYEVAMNSDDGSQSADDGGEMNSDDGSQNADDGGAMNSDDGSLSADDGGAIQSEDDGSQNNADGGTMQSNGVQSQGAIVAYAFFEEEDMPEDLKQLAMTAAKTWDLYNTNDASLEDVEKFVVKDDFYDVIARRWLYSADRTYTSTHTLENPVFRAESIDRYVRYSDDCFSCHIYLEKIMHLTRNGNLRLDVCDMTYYFVFLDDIDDGVDNPHWCAVDMVSEPVNHPTVP